MTTINRNQNTLKRNKKMKYKIFINKCNKNEKIYENSI